jgi:NOL1/NOP2/sun family putative RNA methylase
VITPSRNRFAGPVGTRGVDPLARYDPIIEDFAAFRDACERPLERVVRVNQLNATPDRVQSALAERGVESTALPWDDHLLTVDTDRPGATWPHVHGWIQGQEAVSALPVPALDPDPGDVVLDACAAPGSKTTQLAGAMDDRGTVIANDASMGRLAPLRSNCDRLGVTCAAVTNRDARSLSLDPLGIDAVDASLVDVPCSCEGTVRKRPDALDDWSEDRVASLSELQRGILTRAIRLTRPGGTVVYATCTFAPEENEAVVDHALRTTDCGIVEPDLPVDAAPGVTAWNDEEYDPAVERTRRIYPHLNDTGGFYIARLEVPE